MDRRQLQQAVAEAQASIQMQAQQQMSERMHSICFKRCIQAPTDKLADRQRRCLDQCLGAFMEGFGVAVRVNKLAECLPVHASLASRLTLSLSTHTHTPAPLCQPHLAMPATHARTPLATTAATTVAAAG